MDEIPAGLFQGFTELLQKGDEVGARKFLIEHLKEFPQDIQDTIIGEFVEEAIMKKASDDKAVADFEGSAGEAITVLAKMKREIEKKIKLAEIKKSM